MTIQDVSVFARVDADFTNLARGRDPLGLNCSPWVDLGLPGVFLSVRQLRDWMLAHRRAYTARNAVWRELVVRAQLTPVWMTAAVGMALPGLVRAAGGLARGFTGDSADIDAEMLAAFIAAVHATPDPGAAGVYDRLRWAAVRAGMRARTTDRPYQLPGDLERVCGQVPRLPYGHPDLIVARAVTVGVLDPADAELVVLTVLDRVPLAVVAAEWGVDPGVLRMRRVRATRALVEALAEGLLSEVVSAEARRRLDRRAAARHTARTTA